MTQLPADPPPLVVRPGPQVNPPLPAHRPVRWGILATGTIAHAFARDLALLPDGETEIAAVGSRSRGSAQQFAATHGASRAYGSYAELLADPGVDVVYVATPHSLHKELTLAAFEAGKPVLCEKPLTLNARDGTELVAAAREHRLFLMEAMWMRTNPVIRRLAHLAGTGALGRVGQVRADLGFLVDRPATDRLVDPALGAGALLDMGIYPLAFAHLLLGEPDRVEAIATLAESGIDLNVSISLGYRSGAAASLSATMTAWSPRSASVSTDLGRVDLAAPFHQPRRATWVSGGERTEIAEPVTGTGLAHEAREVVRCLRGGEVESPLVPLADTLTLLGLMDRVRDRIGVRYAAD